VSVLRVSAKTGEGVEALWAAIAGKALRRTQATSEGHELLRLAQDTLARWFGAAQANGHAAFRQVLDDWQHGRLDDCSAAETLVKLLLEEHGFRQREIRP
jgi:hypothetical protein